MTRHSADNLGCELHGVSDASSRSSTAVLYLRTIRQDETIQVTLMTAKSRVDTLPN